jgi:ubiquinone/menaquinone biosynthesis C-methylase UbiE
MALSIPKLGPPQFGLDAPTVVRNLMLAAALGLSAWIFGLSITFAIWTDSPVPSDRRECILQLFYPGLGIGVLCLTTGSIMIWYSYDGKLRMRESLLNLIHWRGDEQVLDVGCGRGLMLIGAAARLKTGKAIGIDVWQSVDLSGNSRQATLANARVAGVADRVEVRTGDAREMPFPNASFDVVLSTTVLHNISDVAGRERAVREIARVLKPGGRLVLSDIRHTRQYAAVLGSCGMGELRHRAARLALLAFLLTFGSVRPAIVTAQKRH